MAKLIIEVEESETPNCNGGSFDLNIEVTSARGSINFDILDCDKYDLRTLKITKEK